MVRRITFFERVREIDVPLAHESLPRYIHSFGFAPLPIEFGTFQLTPMRHRGALVDGFFMVAKEGVFTDADSEVRVLLASQAAEVIENARVHREARRARTVFETLMEASPVGVVVLDVETRMPTSANAVEQRIVSELNAPVLYRDFLKTIVCRLNDGRTVTVDELPQAKPLRAEEVEISTPAGRSVRTLLDVTPLRSPDGVAHIVVVNMQNLEPFEALERACTEFLTMVSDELRAPLTAVKGSAVTLLDASRTVERTEVRQFFRIVEDQADRMDRSHGDLLDAGRLAKDTLSVSAAPTPVLELVEQARRTYLGGIDAHEVVVDLQPELLLVMADAFRIGQVFDNLLMNATRYVPALTRIHISGLLREGFVHISVRDEGEYLKPERLTRLFDRYSGQRQALDET